MKKLQSLTLLMVLVLLIGICACAKPVDSDGSESRSSGAKSAESSNTGGESMIYDINHYPDIVTGTVLEVDVKENRIYYSASVEYLQNVPETFCLYVNTDTKLFDEDNRMLKLTQVSVGDAIQLRTCGIILESLPPQLECYRPEIIVRQKS